MAYKDLWSSLIRRCRWFGQKTKAIVMMKRWDVQQRVNLADGLTKKEHGCFSGFCLIEAILQINTTDRALTFHPYCLLKGNRFNATHELKRSLNQMVISTDLQVPS